VNRTEEIAACVLDVGERIARAAERAGRAPTSVTLVGVGKTKPLSDLLAAYQAGLRHFGENRVQEAEEKYPSLPADAVRHLIGPIQSNKANRAVRVANVIQTVDGLDIAQRIDRAARTERKTLGVFIEVRLGGEATKAGVDPGGVPALAAAIRSLPSLSLRGLMAIPPPGEARPHFVTLRRLAESLGMKELSMGMSGDFEAAVEEGATIVRVGSALFGTR
jgi:pyridoxal phosphate enzyme (YggS family)